MTALRRILQVIGWVWIAAGLFGSVVDLPGVSVFPGIILLFISRVIRKQTGQIPSRDDHDDEDEEEAAMRPDPRPLNTEREYRPVPEPVSKSRPMQEETPAPASSRQEADADPDEEDRSELLERVLLAGKERAEESLEPRYPEIGLGPDRSLSSAEMIARAHRRWDRRP